MLLRLVHTGQILTEKKRNETELNGTVYFDSVRLVPFRSVFFCQNLSSVNQPLRDLSEKYEKVQKNTTETLQCEWTYTLYLHYISILLAQFLPYNVT